MAGLFRIFAKGWRWGPQSAAAAPQPKSVNNLHTAAAERAALAGAFAIIYLWQLLL